KPITGGQLFCRYLLHQCQEDFEHGWVTEEATALVTKQSKGDRQRGKPYSDEYYVAQKVKCQGFGLIKFTGKLFKLLMLTEHIMHECVKKLLGDMESPKEEE
ncbi:hypothetical protein PISMIDRAFT_62747, partial [Pisolithus microcarpus 441]